MGKLLKFHRKKQGLSQAELAQRAELSQPTVSNIEKGLGGTMGALESIMRVLSLEMALQPIQELNKKNLAELIG
jgi:transcriptional regulator with XRE-family HTH domain